MIRLRAFMSGYAKIAWMIVGAIVVVIVATYLEPWTQEYEVKTAMHLTCADLMKTRQEGGLNDLLREQWQSKLNRTGAKVKPENAKFSFVHDKQKQLFRCTASVSYDTKTDWAWVTTIKPDLKPLKLHHDVKIVKEVPDRW